MEKNIYSAVCENCTKKCNFSQYKLIISKKREHTEDEEITYKCENFEPVYIWKKHRYYNDMFFFTPKK